MKLLREWYYDNQRRPFVWGEWDCCLAAGSWIEAYAGTHPQPDAIGAYSNLFEAATWIRERADSLLELIDGYGYPQIPPRGAATGDVILIENGIRKTLCIVFGSSLIGPGGKHMVLLPRHRQKIIAAWKIVP